MTPPFVKIGTGNQNTYADEPIITTIVDDSPEASTRKYRVQVTAADISGSAVEAYNQIWSANTPFDLQGVMTPYLNWGSDFANSFFMAKGTGELQQILVVNATLITDETIKCHDWAMVMHARWNKALAGNKTLEEYAIQHHIFLTHRKQRYVTTDSPEWLTYSRFGHSSNQDNYPLTVRCKIYYTNGSVGVVDKGTIGADQIDRNIACGFKQFGLDKEANEVDSYEVYLVDLTHGTSSQTFVVHSEKITFIVDYNAYENKRYIVFRNSLGGFDTLLFTGVFDNEIEVNSVTSVGVEAGTVKLKKEGVNVSRLITARTGAQSLSDIPYLTSEFFSTERVYLIEDNVITEMVLEDGTYTAAPEDGRVVNLEVNLSAANLGDSTMMLMSLAPQEVPESQVTIVDHNHDNIYYRKEYVDTELGKRALTSTVNTLAADMQALITTVNSHHHTAAQVTFADGETFQAKLEAGKLKGDKGDAGVKGDAGDRGADGTVGDPGANGQDAYVMVAVLDAATAALYDDGQLAYYPAGKTYGGLLCKMFRVSMVNSAKKFLPIGITYVTGDNSGINVFDPVTEQYINLRTWEQLKGPHGFSAYELEVATGYFTGTQAEWAAQFAAHRQHVANEGIHVNAEKKAYWDSIENAIKAGVDENGDTLYKLKALIDNLKTFVNGDDVNLDSVKELADYIKANKALVDQVTTNKVNTADVVNALDCVVAGKVLDGRQGKVLSDAISTLRSRLDNLTTDSVAEGVGNRYYTNARAISSVLTGWVTASTKSLLSAADTVLQAFGKVDFYLNWLDANKQDKTLAKDKMWVGNNLGVPVEADMIPYVDPSIPYDGQIDPSPFGVRMNTGNSTVGYLHAIARSANVSTLNNAITQLFAPIAGKKLYVKDALVVYLSSGGSAVETTPPTITLSANADGSTPFANLNYAWTTVQSDIKPGTVSTPVVSLSSGIFLNISGRVGGDRYNNIQVLINAIYV